MQPVFVVVSAPVLFGAAPTVVQLIVGARIEAPTCAVAWVPQPSAQPLSVQAATTTTITNVAITHIRPAIKRRSFRSGSPLLRAEPGRCLNPGLVLAGAKPGVHSGGLQCGSLPREPHQHCVSVQFPGAPYGYSEASAIPVFCITLLNTWKITAVDQPNSSTPFIAVIGPRSFQSSVGVMSP